MSTVSQVIPSEEARRRLPEMLRALRTGSSGASPRFVIGRHRRPEAVLLSIADYERLSAAAAPERSHPLAELRRRRAEILRIAADHGARNVRVFGSVARGDAAPDSDLDLLVDLDRDRSLLDLGGLIAELEQLLEHRVDVVTENSLRPRFAARVIDEAVAL